MSGSFGQRLARLLQEKSLSQEAFAKSVGVSQPTVSTWLHGGEPRLEVYRRVVDAYPVLDLSTAVADVA